MDIKGWSQKITDKYEKMLSEGKLDPLQEDLASQQRKKLREENIMKFGTSIMRLADARSKIDTAGKFLEGGSRNDAELALKAALHDINEAINEL
jgi:hypothetical protein